jgi:hypothetical protein
MEFRSYTYTEGTPEQQRRSKEEEGIRQEAAKTYGKYIISISNKCFEKCSDLDSQYISRKETKCLTNCFNKTYEANQYALDKFSEINKGFNNNMSEDLLESPIDLFKS